MSRTPGRPIRVGIIGARRVRQGLGPFVARELVAAGAAVPCVLGTRADSAAAAGQELARDLGATVRSYVSLPALLGEEQLDALAILAPHAVHSEYLDQACEAGLHVLCEKPLVWACERPAERACAIAERFARRGLLLLENCQWPYVLPFYGALHPGSLDRPPRSFRMQLSPESSEPVAMLVDALHHPLSCLQTLCPGGDFAPEDAHFGFAAAGAGGQPRLELRFTYRSGEQRVAVQVVLERSSAGRPRPAGLGWDGGWAERSVRLPDYTIYLAAGGRAVRVRDPLGALVEAFVRELEAVREGRSAAGKHAGIRRDIVQRMAALEALVDAYQSEGQP